MSVARVQVGPRGASQLWLGIAIAGATACMVFLVGVMSIAVVYAARSRAEPVAQVTTEPDDSTVQAQIPPNADGSAPGPTPVSPEVVPAKVEPAPLEPAPPAPTPADKSEQLSPASLQATPATVADVEAASEDSLAGIALPMATKAASPPAANQPPAIAPQEPATCVADLGTSIHFVADPPEAFKQAKKENKLVFMLHLSGNFEDKCFTWNNAEALRVGALADKTVADYVNQHFIATYLKVGTFEIVGGQKVGGNVASYFCLPDSSVLHAVAGPVDAKKFLSELRWAVETRKAAQTASTNLATGAFSQAQYRGYISQAHEERYFAENPGTWGGNVTFTRAKTPQMVVRNLAMMPPQLPRTASQQAQVEWLLARGPLTALEHVYPVIWEQVLGEKLSTLPVAQH